MDYLTDKKAIGERIKRLRKSIGYTQDDLRKKVFLSDRKSISKYENGETEIPATRLPDFCNALDCDLDYLFGKIDVPKNSTYDIMQETGLSQKTVEMLQTCNDEFIEMLNSLLEGYNFWVLVSKIIEYRKISVDILPYDEYLEKGKSKLKETKLNEPYSDLRNKKEFCLFQIQNLINEIAKDGVNNG